MASVCSDGWLPMSEARGACDQQPDPPPAILCILTYKRMEVNNNGLQMLAGSSDHESRMPYT